MPITVEAVTDIAASPGAVWEVLTDFASYSRWSNVTRAEGTARVGSRLVMRLPGMSFRPTITAAEAGRNLEWIGILLTKHLLAGRHSFLISTNPDGTTRFTNREEFTGLLITLLRPVLKPPVNNAGYAKFNQDLKQQMERLGATAA